MTEKTNKVSRRDAIKLLGAAAGAAMLANAPAKWSKPSLMSGVLPAHAQTSCFSLVIDVVSATTNLFVGFFAGPDPDEILGDGFAGSSMRWYCQDDCIIMSATVLNGLAMTWTFTTLAGQFTVVWDNNTPSHTILINLGSGSYAVDGGLVDGCEIAPLSDDREEKEISFWG
jgi:hypothetical protein